MDSETKHGVSLATKGKSLVGLGFIADLIILPITAIINLVKTIIIHNYISKQKKLNKLEIQIKEYYENKEKNKEFIDELNKELNQEDKKKNKPKTKLSKKSNIKNTDTK